MRKVRNILSILILVLLLGALIGCGASSDDDNKDAGEGGEEKGEIIIGATNPLSGSLAEMGQDIQEGIRLAIKKKNADGGINGKQIKLVEADVPDPTAAKTEAERLIDREKVDVMIGTYGSSISIAVSEITARNEIPYFELVSLANDITGRGYDNVYRINPHADKFTEVALEAVKNVVPEKLNKDVHDLEIALIHEDSDNGTSWMASFEALAEAEGLQDTIILKESYDAATNDMSSLILKLKNANPDVLIASSYLNDAVQFVRQSAELGVNYPVIIGGGAGWGQPGFVEALGDLTEGILDTEYPPLPPLSDEAAMPGVEEFMEMYEEEHGKEPGGVYSHTAYASTLQMLQIIEEAGSVAADDIAEAAYAMDQDWWNSASGWGIEFMKDGDFIGQNERTAPYLTQWIDGKLTTVYPEEISVIEPELPKPEW